MKRIESFLIGQVKIRKINVIVKFYNQVDRISSEFLLKLKNLDSK
jgi:hypothetical protein